MNLPLLNRYEKMSDLIDDTNDLRVSAAVVLLIQQRMNETGSSREEAADHITSNIMYFTGYYGLQTRRRFERLLGAVHPIFGTVDEPIDIEHLIKMRLKIPFNLDAEEGRLPPPVVQLVRALRS